ncbi:hypothetical protein [Paracoccus marcusii]|uniref:hypothetical protein n=1 Tax=Paracoccus marcusii TaxID=59779 RepID=UPI0012F1604F
MERADEDGTDHRRRTGHRQGIVTRLRSDGWRVAVFDLDAEALDEIGAADPGLLALPIDVGDERQVAQGMLALQGWLKGQG